MPEETLKLLLIEDDPDATSQFEEAVSNYNSQGNPVVKSLTARSYKDAMCKLESRVLEFDGVIVDLKLGGDDDFSGNDIIQEIHKKNRIPIVVYTGNVGQVNPEMEKYVQIYGKGDITYQKVISDFFVPLYRIGITRIFTYRGIIEKAMGAVFWEHVIPTVDSWLDYLKKDSEPEQSQEVAIEKALLRVTINHLTGLLDDSRVHFTEEMYVLPTKKDMYTTGTIVESQENENIFHVILTPACDLVVSNRKYRTDTMVLCPIENCFQEGYKMKGGRNIKPNQWQEIVRNNKGAGYHYLPPVKDVFKGGLVNFSRPTVYDIYCNEKEIFSTKFKIKCHISQAFIKDIVARFSVFYARQGQPDFDFKLLEEQAKEVVKKCKADPN